MMQGAGEVQTLLAEFCLRGGLQVLPSRPGSIRLKLIIDGRKLKD
ncbi:MAG: hypothetical protein ACETVV_01090 [Nitrososphaeria archaeon]